MALAYYDMAKLMRMTYDQKLSSSLEKVKIEQAKTQRDCAAVLAGTVPGSSGRHGRTIEQRVVV
jgi:hypothetical protein